MITAFVIILIYIICTYKETSAIVITNILAGILGVSMLIFVILPIFEKINYCIAYVFHFICSLF